MVGGLEDSRLDMRHRVKLVILMVLIRPVLETRGRLGQIVSMEFLWEPILLVWYRRQRCPSLSRPRRRCCCGGGDIAPGRWLRSQVHRIGRAVAGTAGVVRVVGNGRSRGDHGSLIGLIGEARARGNS